MNQIKQELESQKSSNTNIGTQNPVPLTDQTLPKPAKSDRCLLHACACMKNYRNDKSLKKYSH